MVKIKVGNILNLCHKSTNRCVQVSINDYSKNYIIFTISESNMDLYPRGHFIHVKDFNIFFNSFYVYNLYGEEITKDYFLKYINNVYTNDKCTIGDIDILIELMHKAVDTNDKEWYEELYERYKKLL